MSHILPGKQRPFQPLYLEWIPHSSFYPSASLTWCFLWKMWYQTLRSGYLAHHFQVSQGGTGKLSQRNNSQIFSFFQQAYFIALVGAIWMGGQTLMCALKSNFIPCSRSNVSSLFPHGEWKASEWRPGQFPLIPSSRQDRGGRENWPVETFGSVPSEVRVLVFRLCQTPRPRPRVLRQTYPFQLEARRLGSKIINFASWTPSSCRHFIFAPDILVQDMFNTALLALFTDDTFG